MATVIPHVTNWSVTPQNGNEDYFTKMNVWLSESTAVIASLNGSIDAINQAIDISILQNGAIDDNNIAINRTFSNLFITNNYYNKTQTDNKININGFTDKMTPVDTDHIGVQETGGLFKKLSFANLKTWILSLFQPTLTGTATLVGATNQVTMTDIVTALGLEVGDVIQFTSGTDANNAKMRTVESITDNNTIILNYEHCGNRGNGSLKLSNQSGISCTVKRIAKYYNAPDGLGRDWVNVTLFRNLGAENTNSTNRAMLVKSHSSRASAGENYCYITIPNLSNTIGTSSYNPSGTSEAEANFKVSAGSKYIYSAMLSKSYIIELR